jgi:hypothetical protein
VLRKHLSKPSSVHPDKTKSGLVNRTRPEQTENLISEEEEEEEEKEGGHQRIPADLHASYSSIKTAASDRYFSLGNTSSSLR